MNEARGGRVPAAPVTELVALRREGLRIELSCRDCAERFAFDLRSLCGLGLDVAVCPACGAARTLGPVEIDALLDSAWPDRGAEDAIAGNEDLMSRAVFWHRLEPWRSALRHQDIDLGPPCEREISHHLTAWLQLDRRRGAGS